jgi:hypothetical protein
MVNHMRPATKKLALAIPLLAIFAALAANFPEIRRYIKIRRM